MNRNTENKGAFVGIQFQLAGEQFVGQTVVKNGVTQVGGRWVCTGSLLGLKTLLDCWHVTLPGLEKFDFSMTEIDLLFESTSRFLLSVNSQNYGKLMVRILNDEVCFIVKKIPQKIKFQDIPAIGKYFNDEDYIALREFSLLLNNSGIQDFGFTVCINEVIISMGDTGRQSANGKFLSEGTNGIVAANGNAFHWVDIKKKFGAVSIVRLGVAFVDGCIYVSGDIDVTIACLTFYLVGLYIEIPFGVGDAKLNFGIMGLGIDISTGSFVISGELIKEMNKESYVGRLAIQCGKIGITVLAAYEHNLDYESFFAFGALHAVLGGPPAFVITGLSVGFGVNRNLKIPEAKNLGRFPLIQAAIGADAKWSGMLPNDALREMQDYIYTDNGETMLAAGITFTTFGLLTTCAIATFTFGNSYQIALLGMSVFDLPQLVQSPFVHVVLGIRMIYNFNEGILKIDGGISEDSYIFDKNCKLTGEFALYMWFKGEHTGDFVFSIGGYHKDFVVPVHYPALDRVGINWNITGGLSLTGNAYFALTPSSIMVGGSLALTYTWRNLSAWIKLSADMILSWFPFFYDAYVNASIGASYTLNLFGKHTYSVELSASLHMWGPDFSISVHVKWFIISFTVEYIQNKQHGPEPASWDEVSNRLLMQNVENRVLKKTEAENNISSKYFSICPLNGIQKEKIWSFSPVCFAVEFKSKVPLKQIYVGGRKVFSCTDVEIGVLPMGENVALNTFVNIRILSEGTELRSEEYEEILLSEICEDLPYAIWGTKEIKKTDASILAGVLNGISLTLRDRSLESHSTSEYDLAILRETIEVAAEPSGHKFHDSEIGKQYNEDPDYVFMKECLKDESTITKRRALLEQMKEVGYDIWEEEEIKTTGVEQNPEQYFRTDISYRETGKKVG